MGKKVTQVSARLLSATDSSRAKTHAKVKKTETSTTTTKTKYAFKKLTEPVGPKLATSKRSKYRSKEERLSQTSRELLEIQKQVKLRSKQRAKELRYREVTQGLAHSSTLPVDENGNYDLTEPEFSKVIKSSGVCGVPKIKVRPLTQPVGFNFESDKRAAQKQAQPVAQEPLQDTSNTIAN